MRRRCTGALLASALASCAGAPRGSSGAPSGPPTPIHAAPLRVQRGRGAQVTAVFVRATFAGFDTHLVVDSGSSTHFVTAWLVRRSGRAAHASPGYSVGVDGQTVAEFVLDEPGLALDGWGPLADRSIDVTEVPAELEERNIGGGISPQRLADAAHPLVVDLPNRVMELATPAGAERRLAAQPVTLAARAPAVCRHLNRGRGSVYAVDALVGGVPARLVVDLGTHASQLAARRPAGARLAARAEPDPSFETVGVGGVTVPRVARGVQIVVGDVRTTIDLAVRDDTGTSVCPNDGVLGLDVLGECVLAFTPDALRVRCAADGLVE